MSDTLRILDAMYDSIARGPTGALVPAVSGSVEAELVALTEAIAAVAVQKTPSPVEAFWLSYTQFADYQARAEDQDNPPDPAQVFDTPCTTWTHRPEYGERIWSFDTQDKRRIYVADEANGWWHFVFACTSPFATS